MSMEITGEALIPASRQRVWEALNDPAVLQSSIAGCQQLEKVSATDFNAIVTTRVGPIATTFRGNVALTDLDPPNGYTLTGKGQGGAAGFAKMTAHVKLEAQGEQTLLRYTAQADIGGKLASVGNRLIQSVARKNAGDFFAAFASHFNPAIAKPASEPGGQAAAAAPGEPAAAATKGSSPAAVAPVAGGGLGALVPAWLVLFCTGLGMGLGYCLGLLFP
jgi:carbon monoxide dehydrogenase subunit G